MEWDTQNEMGHSMRGTYPCAVEGVSDQESCDHQNDDSGQLEGGREEQVRPSMVTPTPDKPRS